MLKFSILAADRVNYFNRQHHHHHSSVATNNNSEIKMGPNEGLYSNLIKSQPNRSLSTVINLNNQPQQSNRISSQNIPPHVAYCVDQNQQKHIYEDMRRRSASEKPVTSIESTETSTPVKPVTIHVVDEDYQTKIEDLSVSPPNSYLRKKQINNNISSGLNEINQILNNNNNNNGNGNNGLIDEIPITIQLDNKTNVDVTNNYKKPIAIQNQFLKMQQQLTPTNSVLKPSIRHRYSTDLNVSSSIIKTVDAETNKNEIKTSETLPFVYEPSSLLKEECVANPPIVILPRANRRKQKPFTIECNTEEIREMPTPPTTPRKKEQTVTSSTLETTKQTLTYSNLSLKYIDEATTCGSAPLSPEAIGTVTLANIAKGDLIVELPVVNRSQEKTTSENKTDSSEPADDDDQNSPKNNSNREKQLKKRKHRNAANSKDSITKHSLENVDDLMSSAGAGAVASATESGVNLQRSSETSANDTSMTTKQIRNKERRDRRQRHTLPLVNPTSNTKKSESIEKSSVKNAGSSSSIQIHKQDSKVTTSSSDEDKERSRKNLKPKSSSFRRRNNDAKTTTPFSSNKLIQGVNLPIEKEIKVEYVTTANHSSILSSPITTDVTLVDDHSASSNIISINKVIEWENENSKKRDNTNEDNKNIDENINTLISEEENTFKSTGYFNNDLIESTNINNNSLIDESDVNNLSTNDLENSNEVEMDTPTDTSTGTTKEKPVLNSDAATTAISDTISVSSDATATVASLARPKMTAFNAKSDTEASNFDDVGSNVNRNRYSIGSNTSDLFIRSLR